MMNSPGWDVDNFTAKGPPKARVFVALQMGEDDGIPKNLLLTLKDPATGADLAGLSLSPNQAERLARELHELAIRLTEINGPEDLAGPPR